MALNPHFKYMTGLPALNITYKGNTCDWHQVEFLKGHSFKWNGINYCGATLIFGTFGIYDASDFFKKHNFKVGVVFAANPMRIILDVLYHNIEHLQIYPHHFNLDEYLFDFTDEEIELLVEKLDVLQLNLKHNIDYLIKRREKNNITTSLSYKESCQRESKKYDDEDDEDIEKMKILEFLNNIDFGKYSYSKLVKLKEILDEN